MSKVQMNWSDEQDFERDLAQYGAEGLGELLDSILGQIASRERSFGFSYRRGEVTVTVSATSLEEAREKLARGDVTSSIVHLSRFHQDLWTEEEL